MLSNNRKNAAGSQHQAAENAANEHAPAVIDAAREYIRRDYCVIPVPCKSKAPIQKEWQKLRITESDLPEYFNGDPQNIGVLLGVPSRNLVDLDLDSQVAIAAAERCAPPTESIFGHREKPKSHRLYRCRGAVPTTKKFIDPVDRETLCEIRSTGAQTIFPPSVHPTGGCITWYSNREEAVLEANELSQRVQLMATVALLAKHWPPPGSRHVAALALSGGLLRSGESVSAIKRLIASICAIAGDNESLDRITAVESTAERLSKGEHCTGWTTLRELLTDAVVETACQWLEIHNDSDDRPRIIVNEQLRQVTQQCISALSRRNDPPRLFVRDRRIVRVVRDAESSPIVEELREAHLRGELSEAADFFRNHKSGEINAHPAKSLAETILTQPDLPFPVLSSLVEVPVLRPDGTILDREGYDLATRLLYIPAAGFVGKLKNSDDPSADDLKSAINLINDAICDFCFVDAASKANIVAGMLSPIVRPAIPGCVPLALFDAPQMGTGKTLLANVVATIATGRPAAVTAIPSSDDELRKRLTAVLLEGRPINLLDNLEHRLDSPTLSAVLTASTWSDRILGRSETVSVPQRAVWLATGNNIQLGGDLPRRCYWIRLDAEESRPWQRSEFKHPELLRWVRENRGHLVIALLTLARAWYAAGQPPADTPILGGFEDWSGIVGGILSHAGINGFLGNLEQMYEEADDEGPAWTSFLTAWLACFSDSSVTVSEVTKYLRADSDFRRALPDELAEGFETAKFSRLLGTSLRERRNRRYGPHALYVERAGEDSHSKVAKWRVRGQRGAAGSLITFATEKQNGSTKKVCGEGCQTSPLLPALPAATQTEPLAGQGGSDE